MGAGRARGLIRACAGARVLGGLLAAGEYEAGAVRQAVHWNGGGALLQWHGGRLAAVGGAG